MSHCLNINTEQYDLDANTKKEIDNLLKNQNPKLVNELEQMWYLLDFVWDQLGCDNERLDWGKIGLFYAHPVWILNGLFIEQDPVSMGHRHSISNWIKNQKILLILDYGGGFGTLARLIATDKTKKVDIYEPHPTPYALEKSSAYQNIKFIQTISNEYDCLLSTDVLEHLPDPLNTFSDMIRTVKIGGYLILANCFEPVIKCHLPQTFHLFYTFDFFASLLGLERIGLLSGSHATIYRRIHPIAIAWEVIQQYEQISKDFFKLYNKRNSEQKNHLLSFNHSLGMIYKNLDDLKLKNEPCVIYGAGSGCDLVYGYMSENIIGIVDRNSTLHNQIRYGFNISDISTLTLHRHKIVIAVFGREEEIIKTLHDELGISKDRIIVPGQYV